MDASRSPPCRQFSRPPQRETIPTVPSHRGWRVWAGDVHFALCGNAFSPGYFARLLHPFSLGSGAEREERFSILRRLGANPVEHLHIRTAEEWIRELLSAEGDMGAGNALSPTFIQELTTATGEQARHIEELPVSRLLSWRYENVVRRAYGPEVFIGPIRRRAEQRLLKMLKQHLSELSAWLWSGSSLYGSPDGTLSPVTASLHRILHASPPNTTIVPISIIYDFMTVRRLHIFVDFAPAIEHTPTLPTRDLDARLRQAWLRSARFTCTQLGQWLPHTEKS